MNGRALAVLGIASLAGMAAAFVSQHAASTTSRPADRATTVSTRAVAVASTSLASASAATTGFAFSPYSTAAVRGDAQAVAVGDVNGDFRDDVVLVSADNASSVGMIHVFLQLLDGRLAEPQLYPYTPTASSPTLALGELNNDGTLDIVVGHSNVTLMVANGLGGFSTTVVRLPYSGHSCAGVSVMDINRDGNADVICLSEIAYSTFFFGDGKGGVASTGQWHTNAIGSDLKIADITGDGFPDMIISGSKWRDVEVFPHNGSSGFGPVRNYEMPDNETCESIAAGDFNGDGRNDLAVSSYTKVLIYEQDAQGQLREPRMLASNTRAQAMDATDLDRNGLTDLVLQHPALSDRPYAMSHYLQEYGTGLSAEVLTAVPKPGDDYTSDGVASGDLNGDGCGDVAMTSKTNGLTVLYGTGCATPSPVAKAPQRGADMDGDGKMDLLWHHPGTRELYRWLMDGATIRQGIGGIFAPAGSTPRTLADFNKDGRADMLLVDGSDIRMYVTQADGSYNLEQVAAYPPGWEILGAGDIDRDGAADLFWYHPGTRQLYFWLMDGPNILSGRGGMAGPPNTTPVAIDDFDGDGTTDILLANSREIWMYSNTSVGTFTSKRVEVFPFGWQLGGTGDVDGDGKADLLWHQPQTRDLYYWLMDGATIKSTRAAPPTPMGTAPAAFGDFNGDGLADVLLPSAQNIWMYQGNNLGNFTSYYVAPYPVGWSLY